MKRLAGLVLGGLCGFVSVFPGAAPAPSWLPHDTIVLLSVPSGNRLRDLGQQHPLHELASDPAMRPACERLGLQLRTGLVARAEQTTGVPLATLASLVRGQFTLAVVRNHWSPGGTNTPALLLLADVGEQTGELRRCLASIRGNWAEKGIAVGTKQICGEDFLHAELPRTALRQGLARLLHAAPQSPANPAVAVGGTNDSPSSLTAADRLPVFLGQVSSFLLAGTDEEVFGAALNDLVRSETPTNSLATAPAFARTHQSFLKDSDSYLWIDLRPAGEILVSLAQRADADPQTAESPVQMPKRMAILSASGVLGLRTLAVGWKEIPEGSLLELDLEAPKEQRTGLLKLLELQTKDASPPPFVPTNAAAFERIRLDLNQTVQSFEQMLTNVFPQAAGVLKFLLQTAGQDPQGNIDLRYELLSSLGDDIIRYQEQPPTNDAAAGDSPVSITLIGSTNAANLLKTLLSLSILLPPPFNEAMEKTVDGRNVCVLPLAGTDPQATANRALYLGDAPGYLVVAPSISLLGAPTNRFSTNHPVYTQPRLSQALTRIGGTQQGWFGYEDLAVTLRHRYADVKRQGASLKDWPVVSALTRLLNLESDAATPSVDLSDLPPFEEVARHLAPLLRTAGTGEDGLRARMLWLRPESPPPPQPTPPAPALP